jgi:hypothetical protein
VEQAGELLMAHKAEWDTTAVANQIATATQLQADVYQLNSIFRNSPADPILVWAVSSTR